MKLSQNTLTVLKNYAGINSNIVFQSGSTIKTISEASNILATAKVEDTFPEQTFGIYDLNEFLSVVSLFSEPELNFSKDMTYVTISEEKRSVKYYFSEPDILTYPKKDINMPEAELTFILTQEDFSAIRKAASTLGVEDFVISNIGTENNRTRMYVADIKDSTSNMFSIDLDAENINQFKFVFNIANIKIVPGNYTVSISSKLISKFANNDIDLNYWIAVEKSSTFGV